MSYDEDEKKVYEGFDYAIAAVFASLVFDISAQFGTNQLKLETSDFWGKHGERKLEEGLRGVRNASLQAIGLSMLVIIAFAIGLSIPTKELDERMELILDGLGLLFGAVVLGILSIHIAVLTGIYYTVWEAVQPETARTLKEVKFKYQFGYYRIFTRYFFFLLPFFQGVVGTTIPFSILVGTVVGLLMDCGVYLARRRQSATRKIAKYVFVVMIVFSSLLWSAGIWAIVHFWEDSEADRDLWYLVSFLLCVIFEGLVHVFLWWSSRKLGQHTNFSASMKSADRDRPRMATSMLFEKLRKPKWNDEVPLESLPEEQKNELGNEEQGQNGGEFLIRDAVADEESGKDGDDSLQSNKGDEQHEDCEIPSYKQLFSKMFAGVKFCGCVRGTEQSHGEKIWSFLSCTVWLALVGFSLWLVIVNQGSTTQQQAARKKLPAVQALLYDNIDEGPVCAFDNQGEKSNITTFKDKESAHAAGFLVLHCGACAACSDWHNLEKEYTTRNYLADESARCAKKSFFGGRQAVLNCLKKEPIGFQGQCAECWVDDILCTKKRCAFIFLQATMINAVSDMQVNAETITSAACEEAHCEAGNPGDFVYCSGATRRRMNVTSTISRPGAQRCGIVDVSWEDLFPE